MKNNMKNKWDAEKKILKLVEALKFLICEGEKTKTFTILEDWKYLCCN
jgi:hypothetical protein